MTIELGQIVNGLCGGLLAISVIGVIDFFGKYLHRRVIKKEQKKIMESIDFNNSLQYPNCPKCNLNDSVHIIQNITTFYCSRCKDTFEDSVDENKVFYLDEDF